MHVSTFIIELISHRGKNMGHIKNLKNYLAMNTWFSSISCFLCSEIFKLLCRRSIYQINSERDSLV